jgi:UDP-N-acetylmuramoyl-tripeptide--D-alanyl-D-alanine ligase
MPRLELGEISAALHGELLSGHAAATFNQFRIDSREIQGGDLFFCIIGPNTDGHQFLEEAESRGAKAAIISERSYESYRDRMSLIHVEDTTQALQDLGAYVRRKKKFQVVGITGSIGKTTTKEMTYAALTPFFRVHRSQGNLNNLYGLPLSLLDMPDGCDVSVLEMGMSYTGELKKLSKIADPDVGVLTGIRGVHLEHFRSIEEIAKAKAELFHSMRSDAIGIFNADDSRARSIVGRFPGRKLSFGIANDADVSAIEIKDSIKNGCSFRASCQGETLPMHLATFGRHNVYNAIAALSICLALNSDLSKAVKALEKFKSYEKRGVICHLNNGITLVDDTYNSNPAAMESILQSLKQEKVEGRKVLIFGDMLELGKDSASLHRAVGARIAESDIDLLVGVGELSQHTITAAKSGGLETCHLYQDSEHAADQLTSLVKERDLILVKGSRGMKMEVIVEKLLHDVGEVR